MELANIEKLIEKYLDASTSLQEEATLKEYFLSTNVAPHLQEYQALFGYFKKSKSETFTKTIQLKTEKTNWKWLSVAASIALLVSVYFGNQYVEQQKVEKQYAQVVNALHMVSSNLNKGNEALVYMSANLNKGNQAIASLYTYENTVNKIFKTK